MEMTRENELAIGGIIAEKVNPKVDTLRSDIFNAFGELRKDVRTSLDEARSTADEAHQTAEDARRVAADAHVEALKADAASIQRDTSCTAKADIASIKDTMTKAVSFSQGVRWTTAKIVWLMGGAVTATGIVVSIIFHFIK
jgi:hypothetical protein